MPVVLWRACTPGKTDCTTWCSAMTSSFDPVPIPSSVKGDTELTIETLRCVTEKRRKGNKAFFY